MVGSTNAVKRWRALRLRPAAGALLVACALLAGQGKAATTPHQLGLSYQVLLGPLPVMTVTADLGMPTSTAESSYQADIVGKAGGYVGQVYDWSFTARSSGVARGPRLSPKSFAGENLSAFDNRPVAIAYSKDGVPSPRFDPPRPEDANLKPRPAQAKGTLDPASAMLSLVRTVAATGSCDASVQVYDGRRRFDLITHPAGEELVQPLPRSIYGGPAQRCDLQLKQLDDSRERLPSQGTAWIGEVAGATIPVRVELTTELGIVTVDLVKATAGPPSL
jgi:uncharacterized protein DUF3108